MNIRQAQRRKPRRPTESDYSTPGAYFVTLCTKDRRPSPAKIIKLSGVGELANRVWADLVNHYSNIKLDEFIVMPNHFHGIVWLLGKDFLSETVGEDPRPSSTLPITNPSLPELIRAFKSFSAREMNKRLRVSKPFWQRGYHEHVIRNEEDLYLHSAYVLNNPLKWALDEYYQ